MADTAYTSKENGALFLQPNGPNTQPIYVACFDVDEITESFGSVNPLYCIDENGEYKVVGTTQDPPDITTFTLGTYTGRRKEELEKEAAKCPMPMYLVLRECGRADLFDNFVRVAIIDIRKLQSRTLAGWVRRAEDVEVMTTFEVAAAPPILDGLRLSGYEQNVPGLNDAALGLSFCNEQQCAGPCGDAMGLCEDGFYGTTAPALGTASFINTSDGINWLTASGTPFTTDESISGTTCFKMDRNTTRKVVARGTTDAGNPAEIAYTDDDGVTFTNVDVGSVNGQYAPNIHSLFSLNKRFVVCGMDDGYIYLSNDGAITWAAIHSGSLSTGAVNAIWFKDEFTGIAVMAGDEILLTNDGGESWTLVTTGSGSDLATVNYNGLYWWIGTNMGELFYSIDGLTWTEREAWAGQGSGVIQAVHFANKFIGCMTHNVGGSGYLLMTVDGGYNWSRLTIPSNNGLYDVHMCASDLAFVSGLTTSNTDLILRVYAV